jgi:hydroxymethylpyrimidine/phosphomethylpyrimidine kinase
MDSVKLVHYIATLRTQDRVFVMYADQVLKSILSLVSLASSVVPELFLQTTDHVNHVRSVHSHKAAEQLNAVYADVVQKQIQLKQHV